MRSRTKNINSVADLLKHLQKDIGTYKGQVWYRGHYDSSWRLQPSFSRKKRNVSEFTLLTRFKQNASLLLKERPPSNNFDWLFQMQHHGIPTRLLDWTESPLTGLYFAVQNDKYKGKDGALWMLLPTELNTNANIDSEEEFYIPSFEDEPLKNYDPEKMSQENETKLLPLAAIASRNSTRMQAQLGVFTINHRENTPIEEIGDGKHIWKYRIPKEQKNRLKEELAILSVTKFQLFPELANISELIKQNL